MTAPLDIAPADGKLGVLLPGMGAVATTFIAGVLAGRQGLTQLHGSLTQSGHIRLGKRTEQRNPLIKDFVPLAGLDDLVFGGWDPIPENAYQAALTAGVLDAADLDSIRPEMEAITPMTAVFDSEYVRLLKGTHVKTGETKLDLAQQLMDDIERFRVDNGCDRLVMVWCGSTEVYREPGDVHSSLEKFEQGLKDNHPEIAPSQIYAYAALQKGVPYANGAPNVTVDTNALLELAVREGLPVSGKDYKTGQTLIKTILAPGLKARMLGVSGWFSTNILGNRDGEVLDDPGSFRSKEVSKLGALEHIFQPDQYPDLYGDLYHKVRINYYPPRGDNKEGWDNIDIFGWMGYSMQIKVDFLCRDSILAAPLVLDLALFMDLAQRAGKAGIQEWLSFYYKSPQVAEGLYPEHDLFIQQTKLKNTLRHWMGEDLITHLGAEYYED
ncbi:MAG: inositol-3-phosphate synthase [Acidimicrobiia bacterium]|nr:inositol-3-phosphate synthase [Acidimicrobiia bacterium]